MQHLFILPALDSRLIKISTRLTKKEVEYILQHSGSKLILVDHEFRHLVENASVPFIVSMDTGRPDDPYERFLARGRTFSRERGWGGLDFETDENATIALCYTFGIFFRIKIA